MIRCHIGLLDQVFIRRQLCMSRTKLPGAVRSILYIHGRLRISSVQQSIIFFSHKCYKKLGYSNVPSMHFTFYLSYIFVAIIHYIQNFRIFQHYCKQNVCFSKEKPLALWIFQSKSTTIFIFQTLASVFSIYIVKKVFV